MDVLRLATAGGVDDGKSALIGRLLFDSQAICEDQLAALVSASTKRGDSGLNLSLLTDGLRAERERGITIDVAYRYFATPRRKFIMADCPGHFEYVRNMFTGASNANLIIVLVDARKGLVEQTRRHCFVSALLRIPHMAICVNKMDLVDYSETVFEKIRADINIFSEKLEIYDMSFIPISALLGDNVVELSKNMPWYRGRPLLSHLEEVHVVDDRNRVDLRVPVQCAMDAWSKNSKGDGGYAVVVASGSVRKGEEIVALPSGAFGVIDRIKVLGREAEKMDAPMTAIVHLKPDISVARGDMLSRPNNRPFVSQDLDAMICWLDHKPLVLGKKYIVRHATNETAGVAQKNIYKIDVNTLSRIHDTREISLNDFARVQMRVERPLCYDPYRLNRATGNFILIDESSCATVAAGALH